MQNFYQNTPTMKCVLQAPQVNFGINFDLKYHAENFNFLLLGNLGFWPFLKFIRNVYLKTWLIKLCKEKWKAGTDWGQLPPKPFHLLKGHFPSGAAHQALGHCFGLEKLIHAMYWGPFSSDIDTFKVTESVLISIENAPRTV